MQPRKQKEGKKNNYVRKDRNNGVLHIYYLSPVVEYCWSDWM